MSVTGHEGHQAVFIVRLARDPTGRVTGVVERVRTGEKERVRGSGGDRTGRRRNVGARGGGTA